MLLIAISYGTYGDPFSCSTNVGVGDVNPDNADECRAYICLLSKVDGALAGKQFPASVQKAGGAGPR